MTAEDQGSASLCTKKMSIHEIHEQFFTTWYIVCSDKSIDKTAAMVKEKKNILNHRSEKILQ
jgi:phenylpropionate dioxygenase-like ring-hydroxylating dioxygenase large terminal subunit